MIALGMRGMIATKRCPPAEGLIATGLYYVRHGARKLGEESFQLFELPNGRGYYLQSAMVLQWPLPHTQRITLELDPTWCFRTLRIELEAEGHFTLARYQIEGNLLKTRIEATGRRPAELSHPWEGAVWDYPSALFAVALCKKVGLASGNSAPISVIRLTLPSLQPTPMRCTCTRLFDHTHAFELGSFFVKEFTLLFQSQELLHTWVDEAGVPLRMERSEQGELRHFDLVRYRLFRF